MFEPGDELEAVNVEEWPKLAEVMKSGDRFICKDFLPKGSTCPHCGDRVPQDIVLLEGMPDVTVHFTLRPLQL